MSVNVKFKYNDKDFSNFKKNLVAGIRTAAEDTMLDIQNTAKSPGYVPYRTGTLKRSITHKTEVVNKQSGGVTSIGMIGSNLEYAAIQEFGGRTGRNKSVFIHGKMYITRAINKNIGSLKRRLAALKLIKK